MRHTGIAVFLGLLLPLMLRAQDGDRVFAFLRYPSSAHVNALGGHSVSLIARDPSLAFHNPALLGGETDGMANLNYMNYYSDIHVGSVAFTKALRERSAWGIGATFISYGNMKEVSAEHVVMGNFSPKDLSLNGFFSYDLTDSWRGGVSLKALYSNLAEYSSFGIAVDAGLSYYDPEREFSYGLVIKNAGAQLKSYDSQREKMPWDIQTGFTKKMAHAPIRFSVTAVHLNRWKFKYTDAASAEKEADDRFVQTLIKHLVFGVDWIPSENFWLGAGFNPKTSVEMKLRNGGNSLNGFSAGAGLRVSRFDVGVSAARHHPSAYSLMVSVSTTLTGFEP
ncbi:MAG: type IX secretion system protein PorQ [Tannerella sp.]|nr:type IX secretion system protein PorQ [Tannerella sp.]